MVQVQVISVYTTWGEPRYSPVAWISFVDSVKNARLHLKVVY